MYCSDDNFDLPGDGSMSEGSHHVAIYNRAGIDIGYIRITNHAKVLSIWLYDTAVANSGHFLPEVSE